MLWARAPAWIRSHSLRHFDIVSRRAGSWLQSARTQVAATLLVVRAAHILERASFEEIWVATLQDLEDRRKSTGEFPMTTMTRALAEAIWARGRSSPVLVGARALDVGTGCGVHALLMALRGFEVAATDINEGAIAYARARYERLSTRPQRIHSPWMDLQPSTHARATFMVRSMADDWSSERFSLITFNPPAFYSLGASFGDAPAATGVFVGHGPGSAQTTCLYRFFKNVVLPALVPGGHVICTWPALERVVAEDDRRGQPWAPVVTPHRLLAWWFGITIRNSCDAPESFFTHRALITNDYGLGTAFRTAFEEGFRAGLYSRLVARDSAGGAPSFPFGVLHLQRDLHDPLLFHEARQ